MINVQDFIAKYYNGADEKTIDQISKYVDNLNKLIGNSDESVVLRDTTFLCKSFYTRRTCSNSKHHHEYVRKFLENVFDYVGIQEKIPTRQEALDKMFQEGKATYFKSLDDLLNLIDAVGAIVLPDYNELVDLIIVKTIVILGWYGLSAEEISLLKISDVERIKNERAIEDKHYKILQIATSLDYYKGLPSGLLINLDVDSCYLIRLRKNSKGESPAPKPINITQTLTRFNKNIPHVLNFAIYFSLLKKNAELIMIHNDKSDSLLLDKITKHTGCSLAHRFDYKEIYKAWVAAYYNEKI